MTIKIQTETPAIPIELGELTFEFDITDESINKFKENAINFQHELNNLQDEGDESIKDFLKRGYDIVLGQGSYDKIYEKFPSTLLMLDYFMQIVEGLGDELDKRSKIK